MSLLTLEDPRLATSLAPARRAPAAAFHDAAAPGEHAHSHAPAHTEEHTEERAPERTGDGCEQLLGCATPQQAEAMVRQLAASYGFDHFLYGVRMQLEGGAVFEHVITNYPEAWREAYQAEGYAQIDPTVHHCIRHVTPLTWNADNYASPAQAEMFEQARSHGLRSGISIPVHGCRGETAMLSLAMDSDDTRTNRFIERAAPLAQRLASYAHESLRQSLLREVRRVDVHLTPRETECLRWVAQGKTNWEMARILGVSEHAITYHLRNVMAKLDVSSRHQAVRLAVSLGLLEL